MHRTHAVRALAAAIAAGALASDVGAFQDTPPVGPPPGSAAANFHWESAADARQASKQDQRPRVLYFTYET